MKKEQRWQLSVWSNGVEFVRGGTGPVELMQAACKAAGVRWETPKEGMVAAFEPMKNRVVKWLPAAFDYSDFRTLVIPAEPEPCQCQSLDPSAKIEVLSTKDGGLNCAICHRVVMQGKPTCPNCQAGKTWRSVAKRPTTILNLPIRPGTGWECAVCGKAEREWTYARDIEWGGIGSGVL